MLEALCKLDLSWTSLSCCLTVQSPTYKPSLVPLGPYLSSYSSTLHQRATIVGYLNSYELQLNKLKIRSTVPAATFQMFSSFMWLPYQAVQREKVSIGPVFCWTALLSILDPSSVYSARKKQSRIFPSLTSFKLLVVIGSFLGAKLLSIWHWFHEIITMALWDRY